MKKILFIAALLTLSATCAKAQVSIGKTDIPQTFSILELESAGSRGMRLPQMTTAQRDDMVNSAGFQAEKSGKALGLQIFNTITRCVETWNGTKWIQQCPPEGPAIPPISPQLGPSCGITPSSGSSATFTALDNNASEYEFFVDNISKGVQESNVLILPSAVAASTVKVKHYYPLSYLKPKMIEVEGGTFTIGSATQTSSENNSGTGTPTGSYEVELTGFWMSETQITQAQFEYVMGTNPSYFQCSTNSNYAPSSSKPVEYVNWYHAIAFCNKLSIMEGRTPCYAVSGITDWANLEYSSIPTTANNTDWNAATCDWTATGYRLPTEAEWEYAARGGQKSQSKIGQNTYDYYYSGSNTIGDVAWYTGNNNSTAGASAYGTKAVKTRPLANELGLYDMSGNVNEWCWNWYYNTHKYDGDSTPAKDPAGPSTGNARVYRGSYWNSGSPECRVSVRGSTNPRTTYYIFGIRLAASAQ